MDTLTDKTKEILKKVRQVEIRTNRLVTEAMVGAYHSVFKGHGMDFEEVREYSPGDEVRRIDWKVTAKLNRPFVKRYREERELTILLLVDVSASGLFGSINQSKRQLAAELASVLAFAAIKNNDKVGVLLFSDIIEKFIPPRKGRQHVLRVIREILFCQPKGRKTDIAQALSYLNKVLKRKAVVFLLSDFLLKSTPGNSQGLSEDFVRKLTVAHKKHDLSCIILSDPHEFKLPSVGILQTQDAETGETLKIDTTNPSTQKAFALYNQKRKENLDTLLNKKGLDYFWVSTADHYIVPLKKFLMKRSKRL